MCYLLCIYIHLLLPPLLFCSVLNASFPVLAVKCILYFNWRRKSLKPRCHMFNEIKRTLACVNLGVLYCMHLGWVCVCMCHIEKPYITYLWAVAQRNKQPYGKWTSFFIAWFYLLQNSAVPQIQNINNAPSGKRKVLLPCHPSMLAFLKNFSCSSHLPALHLRDLS